LKVIQNDQKTDLLIEFNSENFYLSEISGYWYRRGNSTFLWNELENPTETINDNLRATVNRYLKAETSVLQEFFYNYLENLPISLGSRTNSKNNKLIHLELAKKIGFNIPDTAVITNKKDFFNRLADQENITKAMSNGFFFKLKDAYMDDYGWYSVYTNVVDVNTLDQFPDNFFPILLQNCIKKKFELRVFYMSGEFYAMAIFSQNDPQTAIDFRHYNTDRPNRMVPYELDSFTRRAIGQFMEHCNLNTGSFDFIYGQDEKLYFLEVNPVGQFGMVSFPCNYNLEKRIAQYLIQ
jgi:ATP-GRASP peptide maturase of grasp-with-spasm system